jgi:PKHD-type hydroxylase
MPRIQHASGSNSITDYFTRIFKMTHIIADILPPARLAAIVDQINSNPQAFESGAKTAGWHAKAVKNNEQAQGAAANAVREELETALLAHPVFKAAALPKKIIRSLVSRYKPGMAYGTHVDDPMMGGTRTDLSFTLFLSDPETYDGGALVIEGQDGDNEVKLSAGSLVLYPTTTLHHVSEVTRGERLAFVGWVRSFIRNGEDREILFDLENLIASLHASKADRVLLDQVLTVRANLMRKWVED